MSLRVVLWLVVLAVLAAPLASAESPEESLEELELDLGLAWLDADLRAGDVPTATVGTADGASASLGAPTVASVWYFTPRSWSGAQSHDDDAGGERDAHAGAHDEAEPGAGGTSQPDDAARPAPDTYCAPRPATGELAFQVLPRVCVPVLAEPAPLLRALPDDLVPRDLPLTGAPAAAPREDGGDAKLATAAVVAPAARFDAPAGALVAMAGLAAVAAAAGSAALTPAGSLAWERLKRVAVAAALYTRLTRESILTHDTRDAIFAALKAKPGSAIADLAEEAGVPRNTATHHLHMLEKQGLVSSIRKGRVRLYFPVGSPEERRSAAALAVLRHETTSAVARAIGATPGLDQGTLCNATGVAPSLAHWHVSRLVESGVVTQVRDGRRVRYYPGEAYHRVMNDAVLGPGA